MLPQRDEREQAHDGASRGLRVPRHTRHTHHSELDNSARDTVNCFSSSTIRWSSSRASRGSYTESGLDCFDSRQAWRGGSPKRAFAPCFRNRHVSSSPSQSQPRLQGQRRARDPQGRFQAQRARRTHRRPRAPDQHRRERQLAGPADAFTLGGQLAAPPIDVTALHVATGKITLFPGACAHHGGLASRSAMSTKTHPPPLAYQAAQLGIGRGSI